MNQPKKMGIVGGMGARAGALFLQKIIDYSPAISDQDFPEIIFHNNAGVPDRTKAILHNGPSSLNALLKSIDLFNQQDVELIALACVTSYYYYEQLRRHTNACIMNPLHLVAEAVREKSPGNAPRVGLLATSGTISAGLFHEALGREGIEVVTLNRTDQEEVFMRAVYMENGFKSNHISTEARRLMALAFEKIQNNGVDVVIGGCTEISLDASPASADYRFIDVLDLLAKKTAAYCYYSNYITIE
ncbi:aspartate/glutamate racemase family protein [Chitinophaga sp. G-6-1-13]|uniref:Aspartate/glutamate racemase family protein n=1 Tax=Chitinophaga fulva TaxID=2728842 RepID=A0A848GMF6_9BACT|nr:amino acid racemase [Chitinophaga fulva]NML37860.1 aspartate/glutamate racemase family protein [Chitinophaga fulva]